MPRPLSLSAHTGLFAFAGGFISPVLAIVLAAVLAWQFAWPVLQGEIKVAVAVAVAESLPQEPAPAPVTSTAVAPLRGAGPTGQCLMLNPELGIEGVIGCLSTHAKYPPGEPPAFIRVQGGSSLSVIAQAYPDFGEAACLQLYIPGDSGAPMELLVAEQDATSTSDLRDLTNDSLPDGSYVFPCNTFA